jgi:hypothetical protein
MGVMMRTLYEVEVSVKVMAEDDEQAWRLVHDYLAATITAPPFDNNVVDFDLLEEAAHRV